jgi:hypothetical protein
LRGGSPEPPSGNDEQHLHGESSFMRQTRHHEAIAGIVSGAANDGDRPGGRPPSQQYEQRSAARAAHQVILRRSARTNREPLDLANLRCAPHGLRQAFRHGRQRGAHCRRLY